MTASDQHVPAVAAGGGLTAWATFARERFQLPALLVLGTAQAASAQYVVRASLDAGALALAVAGLVALLALLRLMDELKDLDRDRVAHPERPLPRGALDPGEARRGVRRGVAALLVAAGLVAVMKSAPAGGLYAVCVAWALLMDREFFAPAALWARPFTYAATHQVIVLPMYAFATAVAEPVSALSAPVLWFGLTGLGASFSYEVCRKLDPDAHPVLRTYLHVHGRGRTVAAVVAAVAVAALAARMIDVHLVVWPAAALLLASLALVYVRPDRFRVVEGAAAFFALVQMLAPTLIHLVGSTR